MRIGGVLVAALSLWGHGAVAAEPLKPTKLTSTQVAAVQKGIRRILKDPESARFGGHKAGRHPAGYIVVCGLVNAKNSYGGYGGMKPFYGRVTGNSFEFRFLASDQYEVYAASKLCADAGLAVGM